MKVTIIGKPEDFIRQSRPEDELISAVMEFGIQVLEVNDPEDPEKLRKWIMAKRGKVGNL